MRTLHGCSTLPFTPTTTPTGRSFWTRGRGWLGVIEALEFSLGRKVKILVPVRDMAQIVASMEKLWRKNATTHPHPGPSVSLSVTTEQRCRHFMGK
jgi:hypothetical protein